MADNDKQTDSGDPHDRPDEAVDQTGRSDDVATRTPGRLSMLWSRLSLYLPEPIVANSKRIALVAGSLLVATIVWSILRSSGETSAEELQRALVLLDDRDNIAARQEARTIALELAQIDYRQPDFPGGREYILGIAAFRDAQGLDESAQDKQLIRVVRFLRKAQVEVVDEAHRPEWAYALGTSLHRLGSAPQARPLLEEAKEKYERGRIDASMRLIDIYLDSKTTVDLKQALKLSTTLVEQGELEPEQHNHAYLQRAQIFLVLGRNLDAEEALKKVSRGTSGNSGTIVFRAQTKMADKKYLEAIELLKPVAEEMSLERTFPRKASYLLGVCAERVAEQELSKSTESDDPHYKRALQYRETARNYYRQTARNYETSHEGVAANLRLGDLLRNEGFDEDAIRAYERALRLVRSPEDFRNRWMTLKKFRNAVETAWNEWVDNHAYSFAIELAKLMTPLKPKVEAYDLAARANQRWAEHLEETLSQKSSTEQTHRRHELRERWRRSGEAYARLAEAMTTSSKQPKVLWISAEHYRKGHDFESALIQLTAFINRRPTTNLPLAFVRRAEVLIDLGRSRHDLDEALDNLQRVIENYPTDPAAFQAQYVLGKCYVERNELDLAEKAWLKIITSNSLTPDAAEWRMALFSLGRLLYHTAEMLKYDKPDQPLAQAEGGLQDFPEDAFRRWERAIRRLDEFLKRYPDAPERNEARYLLAKAYQHSADLPRKKLAKAETENAKKELRESMHALLREAVRVFLVVYNDLDALEEAEHLDELGRHMLRSCSFEIAHTYFALDNFEKAITAYSAAANRFPTNPQIILAFIQMANCYVRLGKDIEARSMIAQANVVLDHLADDVFDDEQGSMTRIDWKRWIDWARRLHEPDAVPAETTL